jgi:hypothetical protein
MNFTHRISFGNWLWPSRRRQFFSAVWASLKIMASAVRFERHPFDRTVRWRTVAKVLSMGFVVRKCFPMLGGEVVEGEQRLMILDQALDRLVVFDAVGLYEGVEPQSTEIYACDFSLVWVGSMHD